MLKHPVDLRRGGSSLRQRRQLAAREERHLAGLVADAGGASGDFADEEYLVDRVHMASRAVTALVIVHGREFEDAGLESGFFGDFAHHAFAGGLIDIRPTTGEGPVAVADLAYHEHAPIDEGG